MHSALRYQRDLSCRRKAAMLLPRRRHRHAGQSWTGHFADVRRQDAFPDHVDDHHSKPQRRAKYAISDQELPIILGWNKSAPPGPFEAAMAAEGLFKPEAPPWMFRIISRNPRASCDFLLTTIIPCLEPVALPSECDELPKSHSFQQVLQF